MIVVIVGPTGIGKTALGVALAKHYGTDVISGDSIQVYRGLDIGSGKATSAEMDGVVHHLIDIYDPTDDFSVAIYQSLVRTKIKEMEAAGKLPLIVGGTGLYIKSVLYDYDFTDTIRDRVQEAAYEHLDNEALHAVLTNTDPQAAATIHPNNRKRVLHAITRSDRNKMSRNTNKDVPLYDFLIIGLTMERKALYERINRRVVGMIEDGLVDEVRTLYEKGITGNAVQAIGYKELYRYLDGSDTLDEAVDAIQRHSRNLARKQYTFFTNQFPTVWLTVDPDDFPSTIEQAIRLIEETRHA